MRAKEPARGFVRVDVLPSTLNSRFTAHREASVSYRREAGRPRRAVLRLAGQGRSIPGLLENVLTRYNEESVSTQPERP